MFSPLSVHRKRDSASGSSSCFRIRASSILIRKIRQYIPPPTRQHNTDRRYTLTQHFYSIFCCGLRRYHFALSHVQFFHASPPQELSVLGCLHGYAGGVSSLSWRGDWTSIDLLDCVAMLQVVESSTYSGMRNWEWAVRPCGRFYSRLKLCHRLLQHVKPVHRFKAVEFL